MLTPHCCACLPPACRLLSQNNSVGRVFNALLARFLTDEKLHLLADHASKVSGRMAATGTRAPAVCSLSGRPSSRRRASQARRSSPSLSKWRLVMKASLYSRRWRSAPLDVRQAGSAPPALHRLFSWPASFWTGCATSGVPAAAHAQRCLLFAPVCERARAFAPEHASRRSVLARAPSL